jgi:hypothetical protein
LPYGVEYDPEHVAADVPLLLHVTFVPTEPEAGCASGITVLALGAVVLIVAPSLVVMLDTCALALAEVRHTKPIAVAHATFNIRCCERTFAVSSSRSSFPGSPILSEAIDRNTTVYGRAREWADYAVDLAVPLIDAFDARRITHATASS